MKRIIVSIITLLAIMPMMAQNVTKHEVKAGETLYSISRSYNTTVDAIQKANPNLGETIMAGQKINIPTATTTSTGFTLTPVTDTPTTTTTSNGTGFHLQVEETTPQTIEAADPNPTTADPSFKMVYEVQKKETLYGIAQKFGVTQEAIVALNPILNEKKLKKGQYIKIPYTAAELLAMQTPVVEEEESEIIIKAPQPVSLAVIMPFGLNVDKKTKEHITMIDFYEGVMLAMKEMKQDGISATFYAYDEQQIDSVLRLPQMKNLDLIIGGKDANNIQKLTKFTEQNNISLVVPLSSSATIVNNTRNVYQVNQKTDSQTYERAYDTYTAAHPYANFIFVNIEDQMDKVDQVVKFKNYLNQQNTSYKSMDFSSISEITEQLADGRENIIIPSSSTKTAFDRLTNKLNDLELAAYDIQLLGYADWQAFADREVEKFKQYQPTFFTAFYNNPNATQTIAFNQRFRNAFNRDQYNTYPRYGMLGYDIANFFVRNMYVEGEDFAANIENLESESIQSPMHFTHKNTWSGFVNNAIMFVKYNSDGTITIKQF